MLLDLVICPLVYPRLLLFRDGAAFSFPYNVQTAAEASPRFDGCSHKYMLHATCYMLHVGALALRTFCAYYPS